MTVKANNILDTGLSAELQGFYIYHYLSVMAARGDYANAASQDVLDMFGNQSAHPYPQDAASYAKYGNANWESVASGMWKGFSVLLNYETGFLKLHAEITPILFNNTNWTVKSPAPDYKVVEPSALRAYVSADYRLEIGNGIDMTASVLLNNTRNWWPFAAISIERGGMTPYTVGTFKYGFDYLSILPGIEFKYNISKTFTVMAGYQHRYDTITDLGVSASTYTNGAAVDPKYIVSEQKIILGFTYSTPLGIFRTRIEGFMVQNPRNVQYGGVSSEDWRVPTAYLGKKMDITAHTELDVAF